MSKRKSKPGLPEQASSADAPLPGSGPPRNGERAAETELALVPGEPMPEAAADLAVPAPLEGGPGPSPPPLAEAPAEPSLTAPAAESSPPPPRKSRGRNKATHTTPALAEAAPTSLPEPAAAAAPPDPVPAPVPPAPAPPEPLPSGGPAAPMAQAVPVASVFTMPAPASTPEGLTAVLEDRVRRLEDALAQLQDLKGMETRVVERVADQLQRDHAAAPGPSPTALLLDVGKHLLGASSAQAPSPAVLNQVVPRVLIPPGRRSWLLWDTVAEARAIFRMLVDPRYHLPWGGRVVPLVLLALIAFSYYWVPGTSIPLLGYWINKAIDLLLSFFLFKVLGHEARRYRETAPDLPPSLRL